MEKQTVGPQGYISLWRNRPCYIIDTILCQFLTQHFHVEGRIYETMVD